jgi:hypothetical protein
VLGVTCRRWSSRSFNASTSTLQRSRRPAWPAPHSPHVEGVGLGLHTGGTMCFPPQSRALASKRWSPGRVRGWRAVEALLPLKRVRAGVMAVAALLQAHRPAPPSPRKAMKGFSRGGAAPLSCCMFLVEAVGCCDARGLHGAGVNAPQQMRWLLDCVAMPRYSTQHAVAFMSCVSCVCLLF